MTTKQTTAEKWLDRLNGADEAEGMGEWKNRCKVVKKKYLYEGSQSSRQRKYQLLWSNIQQLQSAIYAKPPHGVVNRRYSDSDPVARVATTILERSINFMLDIGDFHTVFKRVRDDFLLYGRGTARVYYEPTYRTTDDEIEDILHAEDISGDERGVLGGPPIGGGGGYGVAAAAGRPSGGRISAGYEAGGGGSDSGDATSGADKAAVSAPEEPVGDGEELEFENVRIRYVHRPDFRHEPARVWEEVNWVAFRAFMTKDEIEERSEWKHVIDKLNPGNEADASQTETVSESDKESHDSDEKIAIWEIWDKRQDEVLWVAKGCDEVLERGPPYLELDGFFPCPAPAFGTLTNDSLIPVPDYVFYQDQADEIDQLTARIGALTDALKLVGFYPGGPKGEGSPEIERAFRPGFENKMIAVQSWAAFKEGGGGSAPVVFLPVEQVGQIIEGCVKLRQQIVEDVYQIVGISDIMRGATDPNETAQAQQMKAQFGGVRIRDRQAELARFCVDTARLVGQIISVHCQPSTIQKITNIKLPTQAEVVQQQMQQMMAYRQQIGPLIQQYQSQVQGGQSQAQGQPPLPGPQQAQQGPQQGPQQPGQVPQPPQVPPPPQFQPQPTEEDVFGLLRDNMQRMFRIDIEAESTVVGDESQEKQDRTQLIESATKFMEAWGPMVQANPDLAPLAGQLLMFGVRAFRVGRELEEVIEETVDKVEQKAKAAQQGGGHADPKVQAEQVKLQGLQIKGQAELAKAQIEAQTAQQEAQAKLMAIQMKAEGDQKKVLLEGAKALGQHHANVLEMRHQTGLDQSTQAHQAALDMGARQHQHSISQAQSAQQAAQTSDQSQQDAALAAQAQQSKGKDNG